MPRRTALVSTFLAIIAVVAVAAAPSATPVVQSNWTIVKAEGSTLFTSEGSAGGDTWSVNIKASWRQLPSKNVGLRTASFNIPRLARYVRGGTPSTGNPLYGIAGRASGNATVVGVVEETGDSVSGSCSFATSKLTPRFFSRIADSLFLGSARDGNRLVLIVDGQNPMGLLVDAPQCDSLPFIPPGLADLKREQVDRDPISKISERKMGKRLTLQMIRTAPVVLSSSRPTPVGQLTEKAMIVLQLQSSS